MPPIREHRILYTFIADEEDAQDGEDTDMPPLVDAPASIAAPPPPTALSMPMQHRQAQESMMSSFEFDFSGVSFAGVAPFTPSLVYTPDPNASASLDPDEDAGRGRGRGGRGSKAAGKRAPSYIPRPPNAFILFRSSFIRSQNVPGRVEGNHSTLSKIIGKYWHALPPSERARWEDKARAAQAEHRRRYPDWRFRPGNSAAGKTGFIGFSGSGSSKEKPKGRRKGRIKDGGGGDGSSPPLPPEASTSASTIDESRGRTKSRKGKGARDEEGGGDGKEGEGNGQAEGDRKGKGRATDVKGMGKGKERARSPSVPRADTGEGEGGRERERLRLELELTDLLYSNGAREREERERAQEDEKERERERMEREKEKEKEKEKQKKEEEDERCAKITDLLVEGKTGRALEAAVEEWEWEGRGRGRARDWDRERERERDGHVMGRENAREREREPGPVRTRTRTVPALGKRGRGRTGGRERERERDASTDNEHRDGPPFSPQTPSFSPERAPPPFPPPFSPPFSPQTPTRTFSPERAPIPSFPPPFSPSLSHQQAQHSPPFSAASPFTSTASASPFPPFAVHSEAAVRPATVPVRVSCAFAGVAIHAAHTYARVALREFAVGVACPRPRACACCSQRRKYSKRADAPPADAHVQALAERAVWGSAFPSPVLSPMARVQEGVPHMGTGYPPAPPYFAAPAPPAQGQGHGRQQNPQQYTHPPPRTQRPPQQGHGYTHVRRDTVSFPLPRPSGPALGSSTTIGIGISVGGGIGGGYAHPSPTRREHRGHAYTYPPPYAHAPLPDVGPGPAPSYGAAGRARYWWDRARGGETYPDADVEVEVDEGWVDGGVSFSEFGPAPSPSPPLASPFAAHVKAVPISVDASEPGAGDPYAPPPPLSPLSPMSDVGGDSRFHFPSTPAISSFSTLSGWAGDFSASPPASAGPATSSFSFSAAQASGSGAIGVGIGVGVDLAGNAVARGSVSGRGTPPPRTSGWYQAPGWENSIQGGSGSPVVVTGMAAGVGDAWADAGAPSGPEEGFVSLKPPWGGSEWPPRAAMWRCTMLGRGVALVDSLSRFFSLPGLLVCDKRSWISLFLSVSTIATMIYPYAPSYPSSSFHPSLCFPIANLISQYVMDYLNTPRRCPRA
ncbi:HMG box domain-containing protein [Mycena venus]|uniref:HMG box domain-containing protein n=1 Tax=Mycena venus TaxID=2733690 RepID=A0A8H6XAU6_9AGAR|nr:HMG box domain-containing protein [Mycena venus]